MHIRVARVSTADRAVATESTAVIRERVCAARAFRVARAHDASTTTAEAQSLLDRATDTFHLSLRTHYRIMRVARTIADLAASEHITADHMLEAIRLRMP